MTPPVCLHLRRTALLLLTLWLGALALPAQAARVMASSGTLFIQRGHAMVPVVVGTRLREGDQVSATPGAEALFRFDDGARMALRPESTLLVKELKFKGPASKRQKTLRIIKGGLRYISGLRTDPGRVTFETSTSTIGIRGTDIEIAVTDEPVNDDPSGTYLKVNQGAATMQAVDGTQVDVDPGQTAFGGEPELVPRGIGGKRRPAARKVEGAAGLFKGGRFDKLLR